MARLSHPAKTSFNGGVRTPLMDGMIDAPKGDSSFHAGLNGMGLKYGPWVRRPGTQLISETVGATGDGKRVELVPFRFNDEQNYILEFSSSNTGRMKVYTDRAIVLESGSEFNQGITGIAVVTGVSNIIIEVDGTGTDYTIGTEAVIQGLTEATYLNGETRTILATSTGTVELAGSASATAETSSTGTLSQVFELEIPYTDTDMFASDGTFLLDVVQINDVMYIVHPNFLPRVLTRSGHNSWTISKMDLKSGPYDEPNDNNDHLLDIPIFDAELDDGTTVWENVHTITAVLPDDSGNFTPFALTDGLSRAAGGVDLVSNIGTATESARRIKVFGSFGDNGKTDQDGNSERIKKPRWRYLKIISVISTSQVLAIMDGDDEANFGYLGKTSENGMTGGSKGDRHRPTQWALGAFSETTGYPAVVEIHGGRLYMGNTSSEPRAIYASESGVFSTTGADWATTNRLGEVFDDHGFRLAIGGGNSTPIQWIKSGTDGLIVGTSTTEGLIGPADPTDGFVPGNLVYKQHTTIGSKSIQPVNIDQAILFVSRTGRRIHELKYDISTNGQSAPDLTELAEHVTRTGIIDFAYQREPINTLWVALSDGKLVGFTYDKEANIAAWHQHDLGGDDVRIRSVSSIPSPDGLRDDIWIAVDRSSYLFGGTLSATPKRTIEIMDNIFEDSGSILEAKFIDSYLTISTPNMEGVLHAGPVEEIVTDTPHGLSDGDIVFLSNIEHQNYRSAEMPPEEQLSVNPVGDALNNMYFRVNKQSSVGYTIDTLAGDPVDINGLFPWSLSTGNVNQMDIRTQTIQSSFGGTVVFAEESVSIYADGRELPEQVVPTSSVFTLDNGAYAANLTIGYKYDSYVELKNLEGGGINNLTQGKTSKIHKVMVRVKDSLGLKYGPSEADLKEHKFDDDQEISEFTELKSEDVVLGWESDHEQSGTIRLQGDGPYPLQIQLVVAEMDTSDYPLSK